MKLSKRSREFLTSLMYGTGLSTHILFCTAAAWWYIDSRTVFLFWMLGIAVFSEIVHAIITAPERRLRRKRARRLGYISNDAIIRAARSGRRL